MSWSRRNTALYVPAGDAAPTVLTLEVPLPLEATGFTILTLEVPLPLEATGFTILTLEVPLPLEALTPPIILALEVSLPLESAGRNPLALDVVFDIIEALGAPLIVQFDIINGSQPLTPLRVEFDIVDPGGTALTVTFDILTGLVARRLSDDVQGPVAEVTFS